MTNPAFNEQDTLAEAGTRGETTGDGDGDTTTTGDGDGDTTTGDGDGDTTTTGDGDGDTTTTGDGDGDTTTTGDGDGDTGTSETGDPVCDFVPDEPYEFRIQTGDFNCPPAFDGLYLSVNADGVNFGPDTIKATKCFDAECLECSTSEYYLNFVGLPSFQTTLDLVTDLVQNQGQSLAGCYTLEATSFVGTDGDYCTYDSMSLRINNLPNVGALMVGNNDFAPLTPTGYEVVSGNQPTLLEGLNVCSCETYWEGDVDDTTCCVESGKTPSAHVLDLNGHSLMPGGSAEINLGVPWFYSVAQAQIVPSCEGGVEPQVSWALVRNP